jgi:hypothetical protein
MALTASISMGRSEAGLSATPAHLSHDPPVPAGGERLVHAVQTLMHDATDPVFLGSMVGAQLTFGLSRWALSRSLPQGLGWGKTLAAANGGAFALEGLAFMGSQRGLHHALGRPAVPESNFAKELGHTYLTLGLLKGLGGVSNTALQAAYRGIPKIKLGWQDRLILAGAPQAAAFSGIYLSHTLAPSLGLADPMGINDRLYQSTLTLISFGMAGGLLHSIPGYTRANQEMRLRTQQVLQQRWNALTPKTPPMAPAYQMAALGPEPLQKISAENPSPESVFIIKGEPKSGGNKKAKAEDKFGVQLPAEGNAQSLLQLAKYLIETFPDTLGHIQVPNAARLAKEYPKLLTAIEQARINSPERLEIAQAARTWVLDHFKFVHPDGRISSLMDSIAEYFAVDQDPVKIQEVLPPDPQPGPGYRAILRAPGGIVLDTLGKIAGWTHQQLRSGQISPSLAKKILWSAQEAYGESARSENRYGYFQFSSHGQTPLQIGLVAGGAELAPLKFFVEAGAKVLVVDLFPLGAKAGMIQSAPGGLYQYQANLRTEPSQVIGALRTFAGDSQIDVGFYPYADGLVWLLGAASEAVMFGTGKKTRSVFTLRSPSVMAEVPEQTANISEQNWGAQKVKSLAGLFTQNMRGAKNQNRVAQSIVPDQRLPYAVGNWLSKTISVEARIGDGGEGFAPVGPIAWTDSMRSNKMIVYGLKGAHLFDVGIAEPYTSRDIQAFLLYHDLKNRPNAELKAKSSMERARAATADHADFGIFAQGSAMGSLVYPAGIAGVLGVNGRARIAEGLRKKQAGTYIAPKHPAQLQRVLQMQRGPLAWAFADHLGGGTQVKQLYSGVIPAVRKSSDQWAMRLINAWNQIPLLTGTRDKFTRNNQVFGKLLTTQLLRLKQRGDQIHLTLDETGQLTSVFLQKTDGSGMEYRLGSKNPQDPKHIFTFEHILHLGKPWNGQEQVKQAWKYNAKNGTLTSTGPTRINPAICKNDIYLGEVSAADPTRTAFEELFDQSTSTSLTYPVNIAVRRAFEYILDDAQGADPWLGVDPMRTLVHSIRIERLETPNGAPEGFEITLAPTSIREVPQGQVLDSKFYIGPAGKVHIKATLNTLVHGNEVHHPTKAPRLKDRSLLKGTPQPFTQKFHVMGRRDLERYGRHFDPNVLHQRPIVAQAAGFAGIPNPGVELMAEFEEIILSKPHHFRTKEVRLKTLEARFEKPLFAGREYEFESGFDKKGYVWRFQVFEVGSRTPRVEGTYSIE